MKSLVTIIIPISSTPEYLDNCINSVVSQTYSKLEILLISNHTSAKMYLSSEKWVEDDRRVKIIDINSNDLSKVIHGEYIVYVDPNDWIKDDMIETMLKIIDQCAVDMVECQFVNPNGLLAYEASVELQLFNRKDYIKLLMGQNNYAGGYLWRKMFKRSILPRTFSLSNIRYKNGEMFSNILASVSNVAIVDAPFYFRRQTDKEYLKVNKISISFNDRKIYFNNLLNLEPDLISFIEKKRINYYMFILKYLNNKVSNGDKQTENAIIKYVKYHSRSPHSFDFNTLKTLLGIFPNSQSLAIALWLKIDNIHSSVLNNKLKKKLHNILKYLKPCLTNKRMFLIFGVPDSGNLGDRALEIAEKEFIIKYFADYKQEFVQLDDTNYLKALHFFVRKGSIIAYQAGGNLGTLYPYINDITTKVLTSLKKRQVIILPQTYFFSPDKYGDDKKKMMNAVYQKMKNLYIFVRDPVSYKLVSEQLYTRVNLVPDMALLLEPTVKHYSRENVLIILRNDAEKTLTSSKRQYILNNIKQQDIGKIIYADTHVHYDGFSERFAKERINELWDKYFHSKLVVTDRLHGMIFAAITNTPCVVVSSRSYKIKGVYNQWLKENDYIELVEDLKDLPKAIQKVTSVKKPQLKRDKLNTGYDEMARQIREMVKEK